MESNDVSHILDQESQNGHHLHVAVISWITDYSMSGAFVEFRIKKHFAFICILAYPFRFLRVASAAFFMLIATEPPLLFKHSIVVLIC